METPCTYILHVFSIVVFSLGSIAVLVFSSRFESSQKKSPFFIVTLAFFSCIIVLAFNMFSTCHMAYTVWGAILSGFLFCFFMADFFEKCLSLYPTSQ